MDVITCTNFYCHKENPSGNFFCGQCGSKLPLEDPGKWPGTELIEISKSSNFENLLQELRYNSELTPEKLAMFPLERLLAAIQEETECNQQVLARLLDFDGQGARHEGRVAVECGTNTQGISQRLRFARQRIAQRLAQQTVATGP